jgi:hypothetical protein
MTMQQRSPAQGSRKPYVKPRAEEVKLEASEALFQGCKMDTGQIGGKKSGQCRGPIFICFDAGS